MSNNKIPDFCDKCIALRGVDIASPLVYCKNKEKCYKEKMCDFHCYELYSLCTLCLEFIQNFNNNEKIQNWEQKNVK